MPPLAFAVVFLLPICAIPSVGPSPSHDDCRTRRSGQPCASMDDDVGKLQFLTYLKMDDAESAPPKVIHAAPDGTASGDGSQARPFTLAAARDSIRGAAAGVTVLLAGGTYFLPEPFVLTGADGGKRGRPVTYRSAPGQRARLSGGLRVPVAVLQPTTIAGVPTRVREVDLAALGVTNASVLGGPVDQLKAELFLDGEPLQLARDPNPPRRSGDPWTWAGYENFTGANGSHFVFNDTERVQHSRWLEAAQSPSGLWLFSHWSYGDQGILASRVESMAEVRHAGEPAWNISLGLPATERSLTSVSRAGSPKPLQLKNEERFVAFDALELLDTAGEYWVDRIQKRLYVWPPAPLTNSSQLWLSVGPSIGTGGTVKSPSALVEIKAGSSSITDEFDRDAKPSPPAPAWVSFEGITFEASTQSLLSAKPVNGLAIRDCAFVGAGATCVKISGNVSWVNSSIAHCGGSALSLSGGNWNEMKNSTLFRPWNVSVQGSHFMDWARWERLATSAGLSWSGVGHRVSGNIFERAPVAAVRNLGSVNCIFEHNTVRHVNFEESECSNGSFSVATLTVDRC